MMNTTLKNRNFFGALRVLLVFCALGMFLSQTAFSQERKPPKGHYQDQGIEKKYIRLVVLYDPAETVDAQAEELARAVTVDAIASGAKLTKADAARSAQLQALFPANSPAVFFGVMAKQSGGDCVPPPDCGCDKGSWSDCVCIVFRKKNGDIGCICRLCYLSPTFRSAGFTGSRTIFIVLGEKLQKSLTDAEWWKRNRSWFEKEVWAQVQAAPTTTNLVIKTKSL